MNPESEKLNSSSVRKFKGRLYYEDKSGNVENGDYIDVARFVVREERGEIMFHMITTWAGANTKYFVETIAIFDGGTFTTGKFYAKDFITGKEESKSSVVSIKITHRNEDRISVTGEWKVPAEPSVYSFSGNLDFDP